MEIEMISAMFGDHVNVLEGGEGGMPAFTVDIAPDPDAKAELRILVQYPPGYPEEEPCLATAESISSNRRIQIEPLNAAMKEIATDAVGSHSATLILQRAQEFLFEVDKPKEAKPKEEEVKDPTIRMGNAVTPEIFAAWRAKFDAEKLAKITKQQKAEAAAKASKLTGRQLWDSSLKQADWELFTGGDDDGDDEDIDYDNRSGSDSGSQEQQDDEEYYDLPEE